jgi:hypothetical protein
LVDTFEADQTGGLGRTITRVHEALHRMHAHESNGTDALGEM